MNQENMQCGGSCWVWCVVVGAVWFLVTSGLVTLAWNQVIVKFSRFKALKFWQTLLVLLAVGALAMPVLAKRKGCWRGHGGSGHSGECPYEKPSK